MSKTAMCLRAFGTSALFLATVPQSDQGNPLVPAAHALCSPCSSGLCWGGGGKLCIELPDPPWCKVYESRSCC